MNFIITADIVGNRDSHDPRNFSDVFVITTVLLSMILSISHEDTKVTKHYPLCSLAALWEIAVTAGYNVT